MADRCTILPTGVVSHSSCVPHSFQDTDNCYLSEITFEHIAAWRTPLDNKVKKFVRILRTDLKSLIIVAF